MKISLRPLHYLNHYLINTALAFTAPFLLLPMQVNAVDTLPILWEAGGQNPGSDGAGQAARVAVDGAGNVAVVSGPSQSRDLAVTSYTQEGVFRWRNAVSPSIGTFAGDWVAAAPNGDFVAVGRNRNVSGNPIAITLVRFSSGGDLLWRLDLAGTLQVSVGCLSIPAGTLTWLLTRSATARISTFTSTAQPVSCSGRRLLTPVCFQITSQRHWPSAPIKAK
jgi:hypothetical protein